MSIQMQKQSIRNLVLSSNSQAAWGGTLADAALTHRVQLNASSIFEKTPTRRSDQADVGKGSEFATNQQITAWDTKYTLKADLTDYLAGWMLAFMFGQETVTGVAAPYTHTQSFAEITATLPCTTLYLEDTDDVKFKAPDMAASTLSLSIPERGAISASMDMVGTGRWTPGAMAALPALPALTSANYLLGSDFSPTITPSGGAATPFAGRVMGTTIKIDNQATVFKAAGDGVHAGSVYAKIRKFSLDMTIAALVTDDVNGWFENDTELGITFATNPANVNQLSLTWPYAHVKANKLGMKNDLIMWQLSFDETTCLQKSGQSALSAMVINSEAAYLAPM